MDRHNYFNFTDTPARVEYIFSPHFSEKLLCSMEDSPKKPIMLDIIPNKAKYVYGET